MMPDIQKAEYLNLHTHCPTGQRGYIELENIHFGEDKMAQTEQWSAGVHPWYIAENQLDEASNWLMEQAKLPGVIAIGECGLDKICQTPFEVQTKAFEQAIQIAKSSQKPLIIHCVRAYSEVLSMLKNAAYPMQTSVFHGFDKNWETAQMLLNAGCSLSFGKALFQEKSHAATVLKNTPDNRFFLETDSAPIQMEQVYLKAAEIKSIDLAQLRTTVAQNWQSLFC